MKEEDGEDGDKDDALNARAELHRVTELREDGVLTL